jgi:hypothetical protein
MILSTAPLRRYRSIVDDSARWSGFEHRAGDIVISTPPKCGTTWTQMLCALLIFDGSDFPAPLEELSPWIDMTIKPVGEVHASLGAQTHRRIIKTHTPLDGLPLDPAVRYVIVGRDPRDVAVSWDHHLANLDFERLLELRASAVDLDDDSYPPPPPMGADPAERFRRFVTDDGDGGLSLAVVLHHLRVAWAYRNLPNVHLLHYSDLERDVVGELQRLARFLGVDLTPDRVAALAAEASIDRMRDRASEVAPSASLGVWRDVRRFIRTGGRGEWRSLVTAEDEALYEARVADLVPSDVARWVHDGGPTSR